MKGSIKIYLNEPNNISIAFNVDGDDEIGRLLIFDALVQTFELSREEMERLGAVIIKGGIKAVFGVAPTTVRFDGDTIKQMMGRTDT